MGDRGRPWRFPCSGSVAGSRRRFSAAERPRGQRGPGGAAPRDRAGQGRPRCRFSGPGVAGPGPGRAPRSGGAELGPARLLPRAPGRALRVPAALSLGAAAAPGAARGTGRDRAQPAVSGAPAEGPWGSPVGAGTLGRSPGGSGGDEGRGTARWGPTLIRSTPTGTGGDVRGRISWVILRAWTLAEGTAGGGGEHSVGDRRDTVGAADDGEHPAEDRGDGVTLWGTAVTPGTCWQGAGSAGSGCRGWHSLTLGAAPASPLLCPTMSPPLRRDPVSAVGAAA